MLKAGEIIGSGGFGCVFSPAIVFNGQKNIVTYKNKKQYASKIAIDAAEEFKICKVIVKHLEKNAINAFDLNETPGWFPFELHTETSEKFKRNLVMQIFLSPENAECKHNILKILNTQPLIHVTQSLKYTTTLANYEPRYILPMLKYGPIPKTSWYALFEQSISLLKKFHDVKIYLFDIKPQNIALNRNSSNDYDVYFTDWSPHLVFVDGYDTHTVPFNDTPIGKEIEDVHKNYKQYYESLFGYTTYHFISLPMSGLYVKLNLWSLQAQMKIKNSIMNFHYYSKADTHDKMIVNIDNIQTLFRKLNFFLLLCAFSPLFLEFKRRPHLNWEDTLVDLILQYNEDFMNNTTFTEKMIEDCL